MIYSRTDTAAGPNYMEPRFVHQPDRTTAQVLIVMKRMRRNNPNTIRKQRIKKEGQKGAGWGGQRLRIIHSLTRKSRPMLFEVSIKGFIFSTSYLSFFRHAEAVTSAAEPSRSVSNRSLNQRSHMGVQHPKSRPLSSQVVILGHHERSRV